jgi:hypothetical protein
MDRIRLGSDRRGGGVANAVEVDLGLSYNQQHYSIEELTEFRHRRLR